MFRLPFATLTLIAGMAFYSLSSAPAHASPSQATASPLAAPLAHSCARTYTVRPGDWLGRIAATYHTTWQQLAAANDLANPNLIYPGARLCVAGVTSQAPPPQTPHAIYHHARYANTAAGGQCTWWAAHERADLDLRWAGNAKDWANTARSRGYWVGDTPAVGSIVVFAPGVDGANPWYGHVAIVIAVSGSRFEVAAMAAPTDWVVADSWHATKAGVAFIYG